MKILVVNDDSFRSELLGELIRLAKPFGEIFVVVPEHEQSWKGKSMTRHGDVRVQEREVFGEQGIVLNGTPADCVNIALHHACPWKPDVVLSGINAGRNTGVGFLYSSGTVGACWEANIAGIPGFALSQAMSPDSWELWSSEFRVSQHVLSLLRGKTGALVHDIFTELFTEEGLANPVTYNINLPHVVNETTCVRNAVLAHDFYGPLYHPIGDEYTFELSMGSVRRDARENADNNVVSRGDVSLSLLDICSLGQEIPAGLQRKPFA